MGPASRPKTWNASRPHAPDSGEDQAFVRQDMTVSDGLELFADQPLKREIIEGVSPQPQ